MSKVVGTQQKAYLLVHLVKSSDTCHKADTHEEFEAAVLVVVVTVSLSLDSEGVKVGDVVSIVSVALV